MVNLLLWLWQLPQHLVALFMIYVVNSKKNRRYSSKGYWCLKRGLFGAAVSFGNYILLDSSYILGVTLTTLNHEKGHQRQSRYFGWAYLIVIGLPSILRNIYDRLFHKKWDKNKRIQWYYGSYPENWADKLGNVKRKPL